MNSDLWFGVPILQVNTFLSESIVIAYGAHIPERGLTKFAVESPHIELDIVMVLIGLLQSMVCFPITAE